MSAVSRIAMGWLGDLLKEKRVYAFMVLMVLNGVVICLTPLARSYVGLMVLMAALGLVGGAYIALSKNIIAIIESSYLVSTISACGFGAIRGPR